MLLCSPRDGGQYGVPHIPLLVRSAHIVGFEAEVCAYNVRKAVLLMQQRQASEEVGQAAGRERIPVTTNLKRFPEDAFFSDTCSLNAVVSLGPNQAILVFDNIVLGGIGLLGSLAAVLKFLIERLKMAEMRGQWWAR